jgi:hypothetical protein
VERGFRAQLRRSTAKHGHKNKTRVLDYRNKAVRGQNHVRGAFKRTDAASQTTKLLEKALSTAAGHCVAAWERLEPFQAPLTLWQGWATKKAQWLSEGHLAAGGFQEL